MHQHAAQARARGGHRPPPSDPASLRPAAVRDVGPPDFATSPIRVRIGELDETTRIPLPRRLPPVPPPRPRFAAGGVR